MAWHCCIPCMPNNNNASQVDPTTSAVSFMEGPPSDNELDYYNGIKDSLEMNRKNC